MPRELLVGDIAPWEKKPGGVAREADRSLWPVFSLGRSIKAFLSDATTSVHQL
jgi:hypothetical protein